MVYYVLGQPERLINYRLLQRMHAITPPKRFSFGAAPPGEFFAADELYERYSKMSLNELKKENSQLLRNYLQNFRHARDLTPYVVGRFVVTKKRELNSNDVIVAGAVALAKPVDYDDFLLEHVYPSSRDVAPEVNRIVEVGLEIKLEATHDRSAVVHIEKLSNNRILVSAVPLLYGVYTLTAGPGTFRLEAPASLNMEAGWPILKDQLAAEQK